MSKAISRETSISSQESAVKTPTAVSARERAPNPPEHGAIVTGHIIGKVASNGDNRPEERGLEVSVLVRLPGGFTALLHYSELEGETPDEQASRLFFLEVGDQVTAQVLDKKPGEQGWLIWLSEQQASERTKLMTELSGEAMVGEVLEVRPNGAFVRLREGLRGWLAVGDMAGDNGEQRAARLSSLRVGDRVTVKSILKRRRRARLKKLRITLSEHGLGPAR